ncbi:hypothetical protein PG997_009047 [Apiospora hydei]|uniref:Uncharacterized protein n=1 Tax=Apiospora hydei TaxID=1337664 RepID=A0ABR1VT02_9PEZI
MAHPESQRLFHGEHEPLEPPYIISTAPKEKTMPSVSESQMYESMAQDDATSSRRPPMPPGMWKQWWAEILSCLLMMAMLGAVIGVIYQNNGKPLPDWPFNVSINTIISILSTVLKACAAYILAEGISDSKWKWFQHNRSLHDLVVFDSASRGPWGCLKLLVAPRGLHPVASLGAALIILTLALDPFTQQLVRYYDCRQASASANATLPRALRYSEAAPHTGAGIWPPPTPVLGFIDQGLYNPADVKTPFVCATGNCTFEHEFSTLGFCSTCEDMSTQLTFTNVTTTTLTRDPTTNKTKTYDIRWVNTTLPSGSYAATGPSMGWETWFVMNATAGGWIDIIQASMAFPGAIPNWRADHDYAAKMRLPETVNSTGCTTARENNTWACSGFGGAGAARCRIDPCVKTYRASVENGRLQEDLVRSQRDMFVTGSLNYPYWLAADLSCAGPEAVSRLQEAGFRIGKDGVIIPWNVMANAR